jgi:hypothetical protein
MNQKKKSAVRSKTTKPEKSKRRRSESRYADKATHKMQIILLRLKHDIAN